MNIALYIAAPLLCGLSALCSVLLWVNEQSTVIAMWLFGGFAFGLELCKFAFFPIAAKLNGFRSAGLYLIALALLLISIGATVSLLETGAITNLSQARNSSDSYQSERSNIQSLQLEIDTLQKLISVDLKNSYRQRALAQTAKLAELRKHKLLAVKSLNDLTITPTSGTHSMFNTLATQTDSPVSVVRFWVYLVAAIIIDLCGIVCLMLLSATPQQKTENVLTNKTIKTTNLTSYETVKKNVLSGAYGIKPAVRNILKNERLPHPVAKDYLVRMAGEGFLNQVGNRFQLVQV